jgi:serpin B
MSLLGARNNTETQLKNLLNFNILPDNFNLNEANARLFKYLNQFKDNNITLNIANKIYPRQGLSIKNDFLVELKNVFQSSIEEMDYSNPTLAASLINSWVANQTNNKIENLLNPEIIDENTAMILINAIYFKAKWLYKFDKKDTKKDKFYLEDGTNKDVDMMHLSSGLFKFRRNPANLDVTVCEFPYAGRPISMTIFLPNENVKLSEIEKVLDFEKIMSVFEVQAFRTKVDVFLPKFKFEQEFEVILDLLFIEFSLICHLLALKTFGSNGRA